MRKNNLKKIFNKKNVSLLSIAASVVAVPIIVGSAHIALNNNGVSNGNYFKNVNSTINYIKNNYKTSSTKIENINAIWTINYNGREYEFNSPDKINDFINKNIINPGRETWVSSIADLSKYTGTMGEFNIDSVVDDKDVSLFYKEDKIQNYTQDIYRGNKDKAYSTEKEAKDSFLVKGSAYYFNDIFFKTKEELKNYLLNDYLPKNTTKYNTITIKGPNGVVSSPINVVSKNASLEVEKFIRNNAIVTLDYTNSLTNEIVSINEKNIDTNLNKVNLADLNYLHVQSNEGQSRYVVDNYDDSNLIGPYFYNGNIDIGSFKNKKMWRKVNDIKKQVYVESKIDTLIGSFFSSIINDDKGLTLREASEGKRVPPLFRTMITKVNKDAIIDEKTGKISDETLSLDDWFLIELKNLSPALFYEVTSNNLGLMLGNKYNTFYKIPILYSFLLQRIVSWGLGNDVLDLVNYYFSEVTDYIQDVLEVIFDDKSIFETKKGDKIEYFDTKTFFQIGNPEYDINTSIDYYMNKIKEYPKLIGAMWSYNNAFMNLFLTGGLIPFESADNSYLFENNLMSKADFNSNISTYKRIYKIFSMSSYEEIVNYWISNSNNPIIQAISKLDKSLWIKEFEKLNSNRTGIPYSVIIKAIGMKNTEYNTLARAFLEEEIKLFNEQGRLFNQGYLEQIYNKDYRKDSLANYIKYINANPKEDSYQVYLVYLFAHKLNLTDLMGNNEYTDPTSFAMVVARLIGFAFGTIALTGNTISNIYHNGSFGVKNNNHTITKMANDAADSPKKNNKHVKNNSNNNNVDEDVFVFSIEKYTKKINTKINNNINSSKKFKYILFDDPDNNDSIESQVTNSEFVPKINHRIDWDKLGSKIHLSELSHADRNYIIRLQNPFISRYKISSSSKAWDMDWKLFKKGFTFTSIPKPDKFGYLFGYKPRKNISELIESNKEFATLAKKILNFDQIASPDWSNGSLSYLEVIADIFPEDDDSSTPVKNPSKKTDKKIKKDDISKEAKSNSKKWWKSKNNNGDIVDGAINNNVAAKSAGWGSISKVKNAFNVVLDVASNYVLPILGSAIMVLEIVTMMVDLFKTTTIKDFYVYTTADGKEFIWDGGITIAKYLGFDVKKVNGIESMALIEPIKITLPQLEKYYYYDEIKYYDVNQMKKAVLLSMIKEKYIPNSKSNTFSLKYSLLNDHEIIDGAKSIDELVTYVFDQAGIVKNDDGSLNINNLNKNSQYISNLSYAFSDGLIVSDSSQYNAIKENIANNIRLTNIIQLPKKDNSNNALKNEDFILSGKVYENGTIKDIKSEYEYIIDDSANLLKEGHKPTIGDYKESDYLITNSSEAEKKSLDNALIKFNNQINISKKTGISAELKNKTYSNISSNITRHNLYTVNLDPSMGKIIFSSIESAQKYILSQLNFKKHTSYTIIDVYNFNGKLIYGDLGLEQYAEYLVKTNFI